MKTKFIILASVLASAFVSAAAVRYLDTVVPVQPADSENTQQYESVAVDIETDGDGYYSLMSDIEVQSGKYGIKYISVKNPVLLSFSVSSKYQGGVWILNLKDGEKALNSLKEVKNNLSEEGEDDMAEKINSVIEQIERSGPLTHSST